MNSYRVLALMATSGVALAVAAAGSLLFVWAFTEQKDDGRIEPPAQVLGSGNKDVKLQGMRPTQSTLKEPGSIATLPAGISTHQKSVTEPRALRPADLEYKGSFAAPWWDEGISTSYTNIGLAMRKVKGQL
jgi:hypothetical protein